MSRSISIMDDILAYCSLDEPVAKKGVKKTDGKTPEEKESYETEMYEMYNLLFAP